MTENRMKNYRKKLRIKQDEIADKLGVTKQYISKIENDKVNISIELALRIVKAFKEITKEKTDGKQQILLSVDDLFYLDV